MRKILILFHGHFAVSPDTLVDGLNKSDYESEAVADIDEMLERLNAEGGGVVVLGFESRAGLVSLSRRVRNDLQSIPVQFIVCGLPVEDVQSAVDAGADDVLPGSVDRAEFSYRLRATFLRLRNQIRVLEERDFFRNAARQEEELSSRILDQHLILKQAFRNIEELNKELEKTNDRLEQVARFDVLSGLLNRLTLFSTIDMEIERSKRTDMALTGIMLDIDNFKAVNDEYGHLCGDEVIRDVGARLSRHLRKYDQAGRYGGEEFFILLPNADLHQSYIIAERIRHDFAESSIACIEQRIRVTGSFGVAEFRPGESRENWLSRADRNMYIAKNRGRNRVVAE